jgi:hypothetical protein
MYAVAGVREVPSRDTQSMSSRDVSGTRLLVAPHWAFQRRCEENTARYREQYEWTLAECTSAIAQANRSFDTTAMQATDTAIVPEYLGEPVTVFHSKILPKISLFEHGRALCRAMSAGEEATLVALILMSRYCATTGINPTA